MLWLLLLQIITCLFNMLPVFIKLYQPVEFLSDVYLLPLIPSPSGSEEELSAIITQNKELDPYFFQEIESEPQKDVDDPSFEIVVEEIQKGKMNGHISVVPEEGKPQIGPIRFSPLRQPQPLYPPPVPIRTSVPPPPPPPPPPRMGLSSSLSFFPAFPAKRLFTIDEERTYI